MVQRNREKAGSRHLEKALAAVEAMGTCEAVVVPAVPSPCMLAAGALAGGVSKETVARIYNAMVLDNGA
jgi:hypothetical protein